MPNRDSGAEREEERLICAALAYVGIRDCSHPECGPLSPHGFADASDLGIQLYEAAKAVAARRRKGKGGRSKR